MSKVIVNPILCKGCGLCLNACPKKIMAIKEGEFNPKGYQTAICIQPALCSGCTCCAMMCPDVAITVE